MGIEIIVHDCNIEALKDEGYGEFLLYKGHLPQEIHLYVKLGKRRGWTEFDLEEGAIGGGCIRFVINENNDYEIYLYGRSVKYGGVPKQVTNLLVTGFGNYIADVEINNRNSIILTILPKYVRTIFFKDITQISVMNRLWYSSEEKEDCWRDVLEHCG